MMRIWLVAAGIACGVLVMSVGSTQLAGMRAQIATLPGMAWLKAEARQVTSATDAERHADHDDEGAIKLSDQQIAAAGIDVGNAQPGVLSRRRSVPGLVTPSGDRIARVAVRLLGTVVELRKRLGDPVEQDEVIGYHLERASRCNDELGKADPELARRAGDRLAAAGRRALARGDSRAARGLLARSLALTRPLRLDIELELDLCECEYLRSPEAAAAIAESAAERARQLGDRAGEACRRH